MFVYHAVGLIVSSRFHSDHGEASLKSAAVSPVLEHLNIPIVANGRLMFQRGFPLRGVGICIVGLGSPGRSKARL